MGTTNIIRDTLRNIIRGTITNIIRDTLRNIIRGTIMGTIGTGITVAGGTTA